MKIEISVDTIRLTGTLNDSATARKIAAALPLEGQANMWGEEIYFDIPVEAAMEKDAVEEVAIGTLAYWPTGNAFCIFFGPTPASTGTMPRAYSPVNIFGSVDGDPAILKQVANGAAIRVQHADPNRC